MSSPLAQVRGWLTSRFRSRGRSQPERHVVLDLDETLTHTYKDLASLRGLRLQSSPYLAGLRSQIYVMRDGWWGVKRPFYENLIDVCDRQFSTITVWSAGTESYVTEVVGKIFSALPTPDLVMTRDDCRLMRGVYKKPLALLPDYYEMAGRRGLNISEHNTLMIENSRASMLAEDLENTIIVPAYEPEPKVTLLLREDPTLRILSAWLASPEFRRVPDVRLLPRPYFYETAAPRALAKLSPFPWLAPAASYSASRSLIMAPPVFL